MNPNILHFAPPTHPQRVQRKATIQSQVPPRQRTTILTTSPLSKALFVTLRRTEVHDGLSPDSMRQPTIGVTEAMLAVCLLMSCSCWCELPSSCFSWFRYCRLVEVFRVWRIHFSTPTVNKVKFLHDVQGSIDQSGTVCTVCLSGRRASRTWRRPHIDKVSISEKRNMR